jgi:hypothetical protein
LILSDLLSILSRRVDTNAETESISVLIFKIHLQVKYFVSHYKKIM